MFCCTLLYVHSSFAIILMGKRELIALLNLSYWCLVLEMWLFLAVPRACLYFVIVVYPDHTHLLFLDLSITNGLVSSNIYDKRDDFNLEIINFPFIDGDVSPHPMVCVFCSLFVMPNRNLFFTLCY